MLRSVGTTLFRAATQDKSLHPRTLALVSAVSPSVAVLEPSPAALLSVCNLLRAAADSGRPFLAITGAGVSTGAWVPQYELLTIVVLVVGGWVGDPGPAKGASGGGNPPPVSNPAPFVCVASFAIVAAFAPARPPSPCSPPSNHHPTSCSLWNSRLSITRPEALSTHPAP